MIVPGERSKAVEDLIKEVLRMELLFDLPVDPIADLEHTLAVHFLNSVGRDVGDARQEALVVSVVWSPRTHEGECRPRSTTAPDRRDRHILGASRSFNADEPRQQIQVPRSRLGQGEQQLRTGVAIPRDRDAPGVGAEEFAGFAQHMTERVLRIRHVLQVARQPVEKPEGRELSFRGQHAEVPAILCRSTAVAFSILS